MSCLLGYKIWFRPSGRDYERGTMNDEVTHPDLRLAETFFFEEAEGTNPSMTIRLDFETNYEVVIEVFNPYGGTEHEYEVATPPGLCRKFPLYLSFQCKSRRALPGSICS